jgi:beclin 1
VAPSNKAALTLRLFDLVSGQSEVDHPVCAECADALLETMQSRMEQVKTERDAYLGFERDMAARAKASAQPSKDELKREIDQVRGLQVPRVSLSSLGLTSRLFGKLEREEANAISELRSVEAEREELAKQLEALDAEERELASEEAQ